jgi:aminoglycoside phosphotransferase family enzyme
MTRIIILLMAGLSLNITHAQEKDCTLGLGGKDADVIVKVFRLNDEQQAKMMVWAGELEQYHKIMGDSIQALFDTHPQKTMEDLQALANKYRGFRDKIETAASIYDRKLLATFNQRQYERYEALCREALRTPMPAYLGEGDIKTPE